MSEPFTSAHPEYQRRARCADASIDELLRRVAMTFGLKDSSSSDDGTPIGDFDLDRVAPPVISGAIGAVCRCLWETSRPEMTVDEAVAEVETAARHFLTLLAAAAPAGKLIRMQLEADVAEAAVTVKS